MLLGEILLKETGVKPERIEHALQVQSERGGRLGDLLVAQKEVNEEELAHALATQLGLDYAGKLPKELDIALIEKIPINFAKQYRFLPVSKENGIVRIATSEPLEVFALDDLRLLLQAQVEVCLAHRRVVGADEEVLVTLLEPYTLLGVPARVVLQGIVGAGGGERGAHGRH